jgi:hypothetical protein
MKIRLFRRILFICIQTGLNLHSLIYISLQLFLFTHFFSFFLSSEYIKEML